MISLQIWNRKFLRDCLRSKSETEIGKYLKQPEMISAYKTKKIIQSKQRLISGQSTEGHRFTPNKAKLTYKTPFLQ